jgi:enoyl-CoA hydratase
MSSGANEARPLIFDLQGAVATLRLNRPERLNAVSADMYVAMGEALATVETDPGIRSVIFTGAGRAFCVGADLKAHGEGEMDADARRAYVESAQEVCQRVQELPKPTIAAVNGHAIGAGLEIALSCDFIIVAEDAKLSLPELSLGTFVGGGVSYTLAQRVGLARARELILLGERFSGSEAADMGIATRSLAADRVLAEAEALARELAKRAPIPVALAKQLFSRIRDLDSSAALDEEARALLACMDTKDWREGIRAFHEKRDPEYRGE